MTGLVTQTLLDSIRLCKRVIFKNRAGLWNAGTMEVLKRLLAHVTVGNKAFLNKTSEN